MEKILLGDANFCVLPILKSIMSKNRQVSVVGGINTDPGHSVADVSVLMDYSDTDLLYKHIEEQKYDYIVPGCNDRSYLSLSEISQKTNRYYGLDDHNTVLTIHHKDKFKKFAQEQKYPVPKSVDKIEDVCNLKLPIIIKPIDSFSGKGVNIVNSTKDIYKYWSEAEKFSKTGLVIAEEFIEGDLYSHSAFIKNKNLLIDFFVNEYCTVYPFQVNSSNLSSNLSDLIMKGMREWVEQFARDLNLVDGLVHTQFIVNGDEFYILEVARRCPGDLYSELISKSTGVDYAKLYSLPFLGQKLPDMIEKKFIKPVSRHTVSVDYECIFISSKVNLKCSSVENIQLKYSGQKMKPAPFDKSGIYFIEHGSIDEMEDKTKELRDYIEIQNIK
ncbi:ATP-grasp domain-containing protein [Francisella philomiragia]|uniref:ATP-grasp domain-containing protein n=1 Tax=Francisella philomiragia TaxID=28110 RepID=A0ABS1G9R8_9GAMM|nr:ATP-grasp domain-containing protein [Francisella philomiragia]MBK2257745.1 ATP-grasp domain-containing protein [Francisella philomiragia]MBK2301433.1 ATP-grasp domain-containing protein [Francisella philomiragia]